VNVLDLFSGIGGFSLGLERAGMRTVAFCEIDPYARAVLRKHWPDVPQYDDVHTITAERLGRDGIGRIDLVSGGYPCQPFSHAGKQRGHEDPRHLWPQMRRVIGEVRPAWVLAENVAGHITLGLDQVLADLEADGYAGRAIVVPACAKDAPHIRQRLWIMARDRDRDREPTLPVDAKVEGVPRMDADTDGRGRGAGTGVVGRMGAAGLREDVAHADLEGLEGRQRAGVRERASERTAGAGSSPGRLPSRWLAEPAVGRVANGIPSRMDRLKALGNAVVPQVVEEIGLAIMEAERLNDKATTVREEAVTSPHP
jgi:DNA (cytosine-5)-methyltransferase 1